MKAKINYFIESMDTPGGFYCHFIVVADNLTEFLESVIDQWNPLWKFKGCEILEE